MQFNTILYEKKDLVATITINRPEARNALTKELMVEICQALQDAERDSAIGVVVITGSGDKLFCPGLDLNWAKDNLNRPQEIWATMNQFSRMAFEIRNVGKPVIARVNGAAVAGGCGLVIACDLAIAADHARFMQGGGGAGVVAIHATQSLPLIIGDKRARWFLFTDQVIDARKAVEWGLINKAVPYEELDEEVNKLCQVLLDKFPWSLRFTKTQTNFWFDLASPTFHEGRDFWGLQSTMPELWEGISAFLEKRTPERLKMRQEAAAGKTVEYVWGAPTKVCPTCNTRHLPADFVYCGKCGGKLA